MTGTRSPAANIAVQRRAKRRCLAIRLTISFDQPERRSARFSLVSDVLPFPGLFLFTRPKFASRTFSK
jgi:hypothetical protein